MKLFNYEVPDVVKWKSVLRLGVIFCSMWLLSVSAQTVSPEPAGTSTITLHFKNAPWQTVVTELARQEDLQLQPLPDLPLTPGGHNVTIDLDRQPFWVAARAIAKASNDNLTFIRWGDPPLWGVTEGYELEGPAVSQGSFLVVANGVRRFDSINASIRFGSKPVRIVQASAQISISGFADPQLQFIGNGPGIELEQVLDEKGNSLKAVGPMADFAPPRPAFTPTCTASLNLPPNVGKRIAKLKGFLRFFQLKESEAWEVPNVMNAADAAKTLTTDGVTTRYVFDGVTKIGTAYQVRLTLFYGEPPAPSPLLRGPHVPIGLQNNVMQYIHLYDAQGHEFVAKGGGMHGVGSQAEVEVNFFDSTAEGASTVGEPMKFGMMFPTTSTEIKVPFEFTNLPLP